MKNMLLKNTWVFLIFCSLSSFGQEMRTGEVEFNGSRYPAYIKEVDASTDQAINAVKEIMIAKGSRGKEFKNFLIYRNVILPATGTNDLHDLFVNVEPIGKKSNNRSKISMIITKPGAITEDKPSKEDKNKVMPIALAAGGALIFTEVTPAVENQVYLRNVLNQENEVSKAERKLKDLQDEQAKMEKQLSKLQEDFKKNQSAIAEQVKAVEASKVQLQKIKAEKPK
jgi:cell division protein FtsB